MLTNKHALNTGLLKSAMQRRFSEAGLYNGFTKHIVEAIFRQFDEVFSDSFDIDEAGSGDMSHRRMVTTRPSGGTTMTTRRYP